MPEGRPPVGVRSVPDSEGPLLCGCGPCAVLTGFEPAASTLTGWRALQTAPQDHVTFRCSAVCLAAEHRLYSRSGGAVELDSPGGAPSPSGAAASMAFTMRLSETG